jgi:large repetitive protein
VLGLTNGTTYRFRVRAVNGVGPSGSPSAASNPVIPYGVPAIPVLTAKATSTRIDWTWPVPDGNGRPIAGYRIKLDSAAYTTITKTTYGAAFVSGAHTLCVIASSSGEAGRNESPEKCTPATIALPTAVADVTGDGFTTAVAGGTRYNNEIVNGKTYSISGACFTSNDIGSNNGWWYRNAATGHWTPATLFVQETNQFGATRVSGGAGGCN